MNGTSGPTPPGSQSARPGTYTKTAGAPGEDDLVPYRVRLVLALVALATLPMAAMLLMVELPRPNTGHATGSGLARLSFTLAALATLLVALWQLRREGAFQDLARVRERCWLGPNVAGELRSLAARRPARLLGVVVLFGGLWCLELLFLSFGTWLPAVIILAYRVRWLAWPAFANPFEFGDLSGATAGWLALAGLAWWLCASILAEEVLFRGVLLPRMQGRTRRWSWALNALLQAAYYLPLPWLAPFRFLEGAALSRIAVRLRSNSLGVTLRALKAGAFVVLAAYGLRQTHLPPLAALPPLPFVTRHPAPSVPPNAAPYPFQTIPRYNADSRRIWQVDLRMRNLSHLDLRQAGADLLMATFDTRTRWPAREKLPSEFDPGRLMDLGRNPGLRIRGVHQQGLTGKNVGLAIIDQVLLDSHREYAGQLKWYEEYCTGAGESARLHGAAVASLAVGQSVGVAPGADLYYLGYGDNAWRLALQNHLIASGLRRVLEINGRLPNGRKIRVVSISYGWSPMQAGYEDAAAAARAAKDAGLLVICSSTSEIHGFRFSGAGRPPLADPDAFESYQPGLFWSRSLRGPIRITDELLVPMDSRAAASPAGREDYAFYREGGWSWAIPYLAGAYALAVERDGSLTPDRFWQLALDTGHALTVTNHGHRQTLGLLLDAPRLLDRLGPSR